MEIISSKDNEIIKKIKKLKEKKYRDEYEKYIIEGIKIVKEAIEAKADIDKIIVCEECIEDLDKKFLYDIARFNCIYVTKKIYTLLSDVVEPQGIMAVLNKPNKNARIDYNQDIVIALDGIQDPGNLGTILRTVDSANLKQIIVSKNTADSFNPKVVRSTMGAILRVKVIETDDLVKTLTNIKKNNFKVVVTALDADKTIYESDLSKKVIVIGNEANGVSKEIIDLADEKLIIPMLGKTESLNASVATGIIIYEYVRRKMNK